MELIADDRERAVIETLKRNTAVTVKRITTGDYVFLFNGVIVLIIERKSLADLAASIKDGRMENNNKLLEAREQTNCKLVYIIEGPLNPSMSRKFGRIPYLYLQSKMDSIRFKHNISVIKTKDIEHTAARINILFRKFSKMIMGGELVIAGGAEAVAETPNILKKKRVMIADQVHVKMLACIRGVSHETARHVLTNHVIRSLLIDGVTTEELSKIKYHSGMSLGLNKAVKICNKLKSVTSGSVAGIPLALNMLACVDGISKSLAAVILNNVSFEDLLSEGFDFNQIANIKRSEKRRIGMAIAGKLKIVFC